MAEILTQQAGSALLIVALMALGIFIAGAYFAIRDEHTGFKNNQKTINHDRKR